MQKRFHITQYLFLLAMLLVSTGLFAQGEVGFGTGPPAEKADINGAMIIRTDAAAATPVAGTIRWNTTDGMHDGRTSAGAWVRLENYDDYLNGQYTALVCGTASTTVAGSVTGTSTTAVETPFATQYDDKRGQYLYYGSEVVAGGLCAGNITQIGFNVVALGSPAILNGLTVKLKLTTTTSLTGTTWDTGLSTYYSGAVTLGPGPNYISLTTGAYPSGFYWDGYSNIELEICYDNASRSTNSTTDITSGLSFNGTRTAYANFVAGCGMAATTVDTKRPVLLLTGNSAGPTTGTSDYLYFEKAVVIGSPVLPAPDVSHGPGSVTAEAVYDENIMITDYVFDNYFDGKMRTDEAAAHANYKYLSIDEMADYMKQYRHLPTIRGREDWDASGSFSVGELSNELWATFETHALYLKELNERTANAEALLNPVSSILIDAYNHQIELILNDPNVSESDKTLKINLLNNRIDELVHAH